MGENILMTLDGQRHDPQSPLLYADDFAVIRGDGCFETLLVREGYARKVERHLDRFATSAELMGIALGDRGQWSEIITQAADHFTAAHPGQEGQLRLILTRGRELDPAVGPTHVVMVSPVARRVAVVRESGVSALTLTRGFSVDLAANAPWQLLGAKTLSYATNMAAVRYAGDAGADDVIYISSEGQVLEAPRASVVIAKDDALISPPPELGILAGTTVAALFDIAPTHGWTTSFRPLRPADLVAADGVWLVSSITLCARVHTLNGSPLGWRNGSEQREVELDRRIRGLVDKAVE